MHADIYANSLLLHFLLGEDEPKAPQLGTVLEVTAALAALVRAHPDSAGVAVELIENRIEKGLPYHLVASTLRAMIARVRSNGLLAEMQNS